MRNRFWAVILSLVVAATLCGAARAGDGMSMPMKDSSKQARYVDPVSGKKVTAKDAPMAVFLDTAFKFASAENLAKFRAAPEQYATVLCPVSKEPVRVRDAKAKSTYAGRSWYFCCSDCKGKFDKDPEEFATFRCPVSGETVLLSAPGAVTATIQGREVHFCCAACKPQFEKDAERYFSMIVPEGGTAGPSRGAETQQ